jgi:hypothetical protein
MSDERNLPPWCPLTIANDKKQASKRQTSRSIFEQGKVTYILVASETEKNLGAYTLEFPLLASYTPR